MTSSLNLETVIPELAGMEIITDPAQLTKLSLDYYHFSPILQPLLQDKRADLVVRPTTEAEVLQVAKTCVKHQIPLTVRGAGTGNYGQCIPLKGGIILDTTKLQEINWIKPGLASVQPGVKMAALDKQAREIGWELRMVPSTYRTATIGGFIGGGSCGIGSINYGQLRDRGNLYAVRVVTLEPEPRVIELRGDEVQQINHAYGTNGIITELEIPLAPAYPWAELIVAFDDFMAAAKFGQALGDSDGIIKKLISVFDAPISHYFTALHPFLPDQKACVFLMVAEPSLEPLQDLINLHNGIITDQKTAQQATKTTPLAEFTWNHTTLYARRIDPSLTYLQTLFPYDPNLELLEKLYHQFADELIMHLEFFRANGRVIPGALPLVRYTTVERLNQIIQIHEEQGAFIANPHTYILEDGGMKTINLAHLNFKKQVDPNGLMNPGKMRAWREA